MVPWHGWGWWGRRFRLSAGSQPASSNVEIGGRKLRPPIQPRIWGYSTFNHPHDRPSALRYSVNTEHSARESNVGRSSVHGANISDPNPAANMGILNIQSSTRPPQRTPIQCKYGAFGKGEQRRALQRTWGKYIGIPSSTYVFESFRCIPFMTRSPSVPKVWSVVTYVQVAPRSRRSPSWKWIAPFRISAVANASAISSFRHPWKSA